MEYNLRAKRRLLFCDSQSPSFGPVAGPESGGTYLQPFSQKVMTSASCCCQNFAYYVDHNQRQEAFFRKTSSRVVKDTLLQNLPKNLPEDLPGRRYEPARGEPGAELVVPSCCQLCDKELGQLHAGVEVLITSQGHGVQHRMGRLRVVE